MGPFVDGRDMLSMDKTWRMKRRDDGGMHVMFQQDGYDYPTPKAKKAMDWLRTQAKGPVDFPPDDWDMEHKCWAVIWRSEDYVLFKLFNSN